MNDTLWANLTETADGLNRQYLPHISEEEIANLNATAWAQESFGLARDFVYKYANENQSLSDDYIEMGRKIAERRIVLAGHRLARVLTGVYKDAGAARAAITGSAADASFENLVLY